MTEIEQIKAFGIELDNLVDRFGHEFEMTNASIVGVLTMKAIYLTMAVDCEDEE